MYQHRLIYPFGRPLCDKCGLGGEWLPETCFLPNSTRNNDEPRAERKARRAFERGN